MSTSASSELKNRVIFTILALLVYRFGTFVPIPGINTVALNNFFATKGASMFDMVNIFSGGALERMSIFALSIVPYITASIIMQLMSSMYKGLESLKKEGEYGRVKINQYTRYLTIILAIFQSIGIYYSMSSGGDKSLFISDSKMFLYTTCVSLVGGTAILMWIGERIVVSGIGNGISMIIFVGIVSSLPSTVIEVFSLLRSGAYSALGVLFFFLSFGLLLAGICYFEKLHKRIKVFHSANRSAAHLSGGDDSTFIPLKINISGVIPPIFASSVLMFPMVLTQVAGVRSEFLTSLLDRGSLAYISLFALLILFFCYFYSSILLNTVEMAENLKKSNCFVPGVRPGTATTAHLDKIILRLTLIGAIYLIFVCTLPEIAVRHYSFPLHMGGTGMLIIVNVILDLIGQVQSHLMSNKYGSAPRVRRRVIRKR